MKGSTKFWLCLLVFLLGWWAYVHWKSLALISVLILISVAGLWLLDSVFLCMVGEENDEYSSFGKYNARRALKWLNSKLDKHLDI